MTRRHVLLIAAALALPAVGLIALATAAMVLDQILDADGRQIRGVNA